MPKRTCRVCGLPKDSSEFYAHQGNTCKKCTNERSRQAKRLEPLKWKRKREEWSRSPNAALSRRKTRLKRRYSLSPTQVLEMLVAQKRRCLVCKTPITILEDPEPLEEATKAVIDHRHRDGKVRGLLCSACNVAIGLLMEDLKIIKAVYHYLKNDELSSQRTS